MIREDLTRPMDLGTAGEHLVCADLILQGLRAFLAAPGLPYDVVADLGDKILRVAVKSTQYIKPRNKRPMARKTYQFNLVRQGVERVYTPETVDIVACVALDRRLIGYLSIYGLPSRIEFDPPGPKVFKTKKGWRSDVEKHLTNYTLELALDRWRRHLPNESTRTSAALVGDARHVVNPEMCADASFLKGAA